MFQVSIDMTTDIFKLFKNSIETVSVKKTPRGTLEGGTDVFNVKLDAIVKRRNLMAEATNESEDYSNNTSIHFKQSDAQYIEVGNYVKIDGEWHSILEVKDGKDFDKGVSKFIFVRLNNDVVTFNDDPIWGMVSA